MKSPKMYIVLAIIVLAGIGIYFFSSNKEDIRVSQEPLDQAAALRYVMAWSDKVHGKPEELTKSENGDFYGTLDTSIAFEYLQDQHMLIARAVVDPFGALLLKREDIMKELHAIEQYDPQSVYNAKFELLLGKWQLRQEPSLYLRLEIIDQSLSKQEFLTKMKELGDTAFEWNRVYFNRVVDGLNMISKGKDKTSKYMEIIKKICLENDANTYGVFYEGDYDMKYFQVPDRLLGLTGGFFYLYDTTGKEIVKVKDGTIGSLKTDENYKKFMTLTQDLYRYSMLLPESQP
ncbi:MAG: hypothetical protein ABI430_00360 [Candidatus Taylorbacteria bacterium]